MSLTSPALVQVWQPNKSNTSRNSNTPCGFLVKNKRCHNPGCDYSHEAWRVRAWLSKHASKPCRWGEACPHFTAGNCLFYHPLEHIQSDLNRETVIKKDLKFTEPLHVHSLVAEQDVRIRDKGDLASFNKLSDDEIAVPGMSKQTIRTLSTPHLTFNKYRLPTTLPPHHQASHHHTRLAQHNPPTHLRQIHPPL